MAGEGRVHRHTKRTYMLFFKFFSPLLLDTLIMEMCAGLSSQGATLLDQRGNTYAKNTTFHLLPLLFK